MLTSTKRREAKRRLDDKAAVAAVEIASAAYKRKCAQEGEGHVTVELTDWLVRALLENLGCYYDEHDLDLRICAAGQALANLPEQPNGTHLQRMPVQAEEIHRRYIEGLDNKSLARVKTMRVTSNGVSSRMSVSEILAKANP